MKASEKSKPEYSEKMMIGLIRETKTIDDLTNLCKLLRAVEKQNDLVITYKMNKEVRLQQQTIIYGGDILGDKTT
ncbi:hypothetical protein [Chryseobacterium luquanense]|uniref:Uncharacterized protein n=1 Tax=Chryseobacterium luquanense TaxID=2983766 RepID=A0ABT3Y4K1_9FLAO|nr:hypothetical protein [Chryseobacterium luquanense]MCX8533069.1 hypothetical protein [Chryseobacterium luquanense]